MEIFLFSDFLQAVHDGATANLIGGSHAEGVTGVRAVAFGKSNELFLLENGDLLASGAGDHGELGLGGKVATIEQ